MLVNKAINLIALLSIPVWILFAYLAKPLVTGIEYSSPVPEIILSSKSALFFFNIIAIAIIGGYIASKFRKRKLLYISIQATTFALVILVAWVTSGIHHSTTGATF